MNRAERERLAVVIDAPSEEQPVAAVLRPVLVTELYGRDSFGGRNVVGRVRRRGCTTDDATSCVEFAAYSAQLGVRGGVGGARGRTCRLRYTLTPEETSAAS